MAFRIVDRAGHVLSSKDPARCGQRLRSGAFRQRLDLALEGTPQFVRPYPETELSVRGASGEARPVAWFLAPIRAGNEPPFAALAMGVETDRELETIFSAARPGETAEAYAFSDDGVMLTSTRFLDQLTSVGALPTGTTSGAFLVPVRDPGAKLEASFVPSLEPAARPLTRAAALALAARTKTAEAERRGVVPGPYRGYRGDEVIGVWRWLPAYDFGVIAEISTTEAFATLRFYRQFRNPRRSDRAFADRGIAGGFHVVAVAAAVRKAAEAGRLHARATGERRWDGDDLSRAARAAQTSDCDQDTEETYRDRRVHSPLSSARCSSPASYCIRIP